MRNVLEVAPIAALARSIADKAPHKAVAARLARLALEDLQADARNFRLASADEIAAAAAPWVRRAQRAGDEIFCFAPDRAAVARLRRIARAVADTCAEIEHRAQSSCLSARDANAQAAARDFIDKIDRATLAVVEAKARVFARQRKNRLDEERAHVRLFEDEEAYAAPGRSWRRVTSLAQLWEIGREFSNCLARSSRHVGGFARRLRDGTAQFWVLRDRNGKGLMVVMACMLEQRVHEARGPRNAPVGTEDPDLRNLAEARGWVRPHTAAPRRPAEAERGRREMQDLLQLARSCGLSVRLARRET